MNAATCIASISVLAIVALVTLALTLLGWARERHRYVRSLAMIALHLRAGEDIKALEAVRNALAELGGGRL